MKSLIMISLSFLSVIGPSFSAFAGGNDDPVTGPSMPPQAEGPHGKIKSSERDQQDAPSYIGSCAEGYSPVLVMRPGDKYYSVECEVGPDFPTGG